MIEIEGTELRDPCAECGVLGVFQTAELAERVGEAWADEQLNDCLGINPDFTSWEEREEILKKRGWSEGPDRRDNGNWRYSIEGEDENDDKMLRLEVNKWRVVTRVDGFENSDEENDDDDGEEDGEKDGGGDGDDGDEEEMDDDEKNSDGAETSLFGEPFPSQ